MRIQILGTAAAEGWPALFCACKPCQRARQAGGRNVRSRASLMVNDNIKIDFNADSYYHLLKYGLDYSKLEHIVFTHSHNDHISVGELEYMRAPFAHGRTNETIDIWSSSDVANVIRNRYPAPQGKGMLLNEVQPYKTVDLSGLPATPITAVHKADELCLNWLLGPLDGAVLYTADTGLYGDATWEFLTSVKLKMVISECTFGFQGESDTHLSVSGCREIHRRLSDSGSLGSQTPFIITHFSHNVGFLHEEIEERVANDGFIVAYDGMVIEVDV
ncbi:MAG: MBL fold metallo-hydrolase [Armatimonadota bacterium]